MRFLTLVVSFTFGILNPQFSFALPAQVLIIRHGEKPPTGNELSPLGLERAQKLVSFFETDPLVNRFGAIAGIYAMKPNGPSGSVRAIQTITPTASALRITPNTQFQRNDIAKLVRDLMQDADYNGRTVLICWEHNVIPSIAKALGLKNGPKNWDGDTAFDRMWVLTYASNGSVTFQDVGEHVLSSDSP